MSLLLAVVALLARTGSDPTAVEVGSHAIPRSEVFLTVLGGKAPPDPATSAYDEKLRQKSCRAILTSARFAAEKLALENARVWPSQEVYQHELDAYMPTKAEFEQDCENLNKRNEKLDRAVVESESDPTRDYEIWKELVAPYMPYESWVSFRKTLRGRKLGPYPTKVNDQSYASLRQSITSQWIETRFQAWLLAREQATAGQKQKWNDSIQDQFWTAFLKQTQIAIAPEWKCPVPAAADFRASRMAPPELRKRSEKK